MYIFSFSPIKNCILNLGGYTKEICPFFSGYIYFRKKFSIRLESSASSFDSGTKVNAKENVLKLTPSNANDVCGLKATPCCIAATPTCPASAPSPSIAFKPITVLSVLVNPALAFLLALTFSATCLAAATVPISIPLKLAPSDT